MLFMDNRALSSFHLGSAVSDHTCMKPRTRSQFGAFVWIIILAIDHGWIFVFALREERWQKSGRSHRARPVAGNQKPTLSAS